MYHEPAVGIRRADVPFCSGLVALSLSSLCRRVHKAQPGKNQTRKKPGQAGRLRDKTIKLFIMTKKKTLGIIKMTYIFRNAYLVGIKNFDQSYTSSGRNKGRNKN